MYRYDLTDAQWERVQPLFPDRYHKGQAGRPWNDHRPLVNGILWHLHTGAPWADTPDRYGPWKTVYDRFNRWRQDGTWAKILDTLLRQLDRAGLIDRDLWCLDATVNRANVAAAGAKKKSRPVAAAGRAAGDAAARAGGSRAGPLAGGLRDEDAPGL
jgi:transposase